MMLYPSMTELLEKVNSRYMLVNVAASRARTIAENIDESGMILDKKPVSCAIEELADGRLKVQFEAAEV